MEDGAVQTGIWPLPGYGCFAYSVNAGGGGVLFWACKQTFLRPRYNKLFFGAATFVCGYVFYITLSKAGKGINVFLTIKIIGIIWSCKNLAHTLPFLIIV